MSKRSERSPRALARAYFREASKEQGGAHESAAASEQWMAGSSPAMTPESDGAENSDNAARRYTNTWLLAQAGPHPDPPPQAGEGEEGSQAGEGEERTQAGDGNAGAAQGLSLTERARALYED